MPAAERACFLARACALGVLFSSLFDGVALSLIPASVRTLAFDNYAGGGGGVPGAGLGALSQIALPRLRPDRAIGWPLAPAFIASSAWLPPERLVEAGRAALAAVAATGAAAGLVFKGGLDLCTQIAPVEDRGKLISSYHVACYLVASRCRCWRSASLGPDRPDRRAGGPVGDRRRSGRPGPGRSGCARCRACTRPTTPRR